MPSPITSLASPLLAALSAAAQDPVGIAPPRDQTTPLRVVLTPDEHGRGTFRLPADPTGYIVPFASGLDLPAQDPASAAWLRAGSPWELVELPLLGLRYGARTLVVILPWPHYARLHVSDRAEIRFSLPAGRHDAAPCAVLACWTDDAPLAIARVWRRWRRGGGDLGLVPPPVPWSARWSGTQLDRLLGAPHLYLWGNGRFSHHDIARQRWIAAARAIRDAAAGDLLATLRVRWSEAERNALDTLAAAEHPEAWLLRQVATAVDRALGEQEWWEADARDGEDAAAVLARRLTMTLGHAAIAAPSAWGDGRSVALCDGLHDAGIERALLLTSDLYARSTRPEVVRHAQRLRYLFGPYDSYHSVHDPEAHLDDTWETAQFDAEAYRSGRVRRADGSGHEGFRGRGFHFAPAAAWPYVQQRVGGMLDAAPFTAWFVDCDGTGESFEDHTPGRATTRPEDLYLRRERLAWLHESHGLVVGSEGGSALFVDLLDFGHGVETPYLGHLDPAFRDPESPHHLGRHWPADTPAHSFRSIPLPASLHTPWFDPSRRIPLYRAALGDEILTSHHWSFDMLKLADVRLERELLGLLAATPPLLHLSRSAWPHRRAWLVRHTTFWAPLHRQVGTSPLVDFAWLDRDRLLQRSTFATPDGDVRVTVNFDALPRGDHPGRSATVDGPGWIAAGLAPACYEAR